MGYNKTISCRINEQDFEFMKMICKNRDEYMSDFIRRAIKKELVRISNPSGEDKEEIDFGRRLR